MTIYEIEQEVINFHNTYENNAKKYGYETRKDTKELDLDSPNGRTMIATVFEILQPYTEKIEKLEEENKILQIKYAKDIVAKDKEIERLNNIINEFEKWLKAHLDEEFYWFKMYDKLQGLKGDSSNE